MQRMALLCVSALSLACAAGGQQSSQKPLRSPTYDYPPVPATTTASGETLGAHGQNPEDALENGPSIETGPELGQARYKAPGWTIENGKPKYDSERRGNRNTSATVSPEEEEQQTIERR